MRLVSLQSLVTLKYWSARASFHAVVTRRGGRVSGEYDEKGQLKPGAEVDAIIEADSSAATIKKAKLVRLSRFENIHSRKGYGRAASVVNASTKTKIKVKSISTPLASSTMSHGKSGSIRSVGCV
jgi:hypothetical protein